MVDPMNPIGIEPLDPVLTVIAWVGALAGIAVAVLAVASLVARYRAAQGEERQRIRLLAYVGLIAIGLFLVALATSFGLHEGESSTLNSVAFFACFIAFGIGIPAAAAVAVIRYRLWDLDVVLKKTIVATSLVLFLMVTALVMFVVPVLVVACPSTRPG